MGRVSVTESLLSTARSTHGTRNPRRPEVGESASGTRLLPSKGRMLYWICTTHCTETKPLSICGRKVTNCHMSLCCAYVKWAQPIAFAHSLCDLLSHTMSALLSPALMLCNLLCRSAAGSSPFPIVATFCHISVALVSPDALQSVALPSASPAVTFAAACWATKEQAGCGQGRALLSCRLRALQPLYGVWAAWQESVT